LVIVAGTSLKVAPVSKVIDLVDEKVPQILINREVVAKPHEFDIELLGNCDAVCLELARRLKWDIIGSSTVIPAPTPAIDKTPTIVNEKGNTDNQKLDAIFTQSSKANHGHRYLFSGAVESDSEESDDESQLNGRSTEEVPKKEEEKDPGASDCLQTNSKSAAENPHPNNVDQVNIDNTDIGKKNTDSSAKTIKGQKAAINLNGTESQNSSAAVDVSIKAGPAVAKRPQECESVDGYGGTTKISKKE